MSKARTLTPEDSISRTALPAAQRVAPLAYRVDDAAATIGVSDTKVWGLIREGRLPARRLDGSTIIRYEDLVAFVDGLPLVRQLAEPSPDPPPPPPATPRPVPPPIPTTPTRRSPAPASHPPPTPPPLAEAGARPPARPSAGEACAAAAIGPDRSGSKSAIRTGAHREAAPAA